MWQQTIVNIDTSGTVMDFLLKSQEANGKFPEIIKPVIPDIIKAYAGISTMMTDADSKIYLDLTGSQIPGPRIQ